ncbi:uncharacterized protein [Apostichopus japonicus]
MAQSKVKWCIATVLFQFVKSTEFCDHKDLYLRLGSRGLVSCDFGTFRVVGWLIGEDVDDRSPTIFVEDSQPKGPGYENGEYDMFQNGSLIINKVTLQHEQLFTARIVRDTDVEHYTIEVKVYVLPVPVYPVVNGLTNQQHVVINDYSGGLLNCTMDRVRPNIELELVFLDHVPQDVSLISIHSSVNNTDGTYNVSLVTHLTVGSNLIGRLTLQCRVAGQMANYFPSVTLIDVLVLSNGLWKSYPTINGLTNQQHVVLDINREDKLTCSWNGVPKSGYLKWDIINPSSDQIIMTDHHTHTRDNGDGTYDLSLHSTLSVHNPSVLRVTLHCKVAAPTDHWYPEITTAELLLPANFDCLPAFPVINGLTCHQHVVLDVQRTDVLTCSMHRVSQEVSLQWFIITPDSSEDVSLDHQLSRSDNEDGTVNITLNSTVTVTSLSINRVTLQCKVSGLPADSPQVSSSQVELLFPTISENCISWVWLIGIWIFVIIILIMVKWIKLRRNR